MRYGKIILSAILITSLLSPLLVTSCGGSSSGPELSDVKAIYVRNDKAQITWLTNSYATGQVDYGLDDTYGTTTELDTGLKILHSVVLNDLEPETTYHYRVRSKAGGKEAVSDDKTFTTDAAP
ncbi:fibronectin type III domain-containing protein [Chloroflexota bacterium]